VESLASDAATAEEEHVRLGLVELDVERARWLIKSYLRCRLDKIERHAQYLQHDTQSRERMSDLEKGYCVK
jgi:GINS complex subunit 4